MRRQRARHSDSASTIQRTAVAVLAVANAVACAATYYCLRALGQAETSYEFKQPALDLSGLYEDPVPIATVAETDVPWLAISAPPKSEPDLLEAPKAQAVPADLQDETREPVLPTPEVAALGAASPAQNSWVRKWEVPEGSNIPAPAIETLPPVLESEEETVPPVLEAEEDPELDKDPEGLPTHAAQWPSLGSELLAEARGLSLACPPCSGKVRGPVPTTKRAPGPEVSDCTFVEHPTMFLQDFALDVQYKYTLDVAKVFCIELGEHCSGVTCDDVDKSCTVRSGSNPNPSPSQSETSYVKVCPHLFYESGGRGAGAECKGEVGPPPGRNPGPEAKDLHGAAIVILAHNRGENLAACLEALLHQAEIEIFELFVSLDDKESVPAMTAVVEAASSMHGKKITVWEVDKFQADPSKHNKDQMAWFLMNAGKIAHHYKTVLERTFMEKDFSQAIFLEEDLVSAPDFLAFFRSTAWLLTHDESLWCVSAWNDIGMASAFSDECRLMRTSYFPGLGFLLTRKAWLHLRTVWPIAPTMGWDYWMRVAFRKERKECIIPEVSRTHHISKGGSSVNDEKQIRLLRSMALARTVSICNVDEPCFQFGDISYLLNEAYEELLQKVVADAPEVSMNSGCDGCSPDEVYLVPYVFESYGSFVERGGLRPQGTHAAIPQDIRSEHYGVVNARDLQTRARLLLVDRRSPRGYLPAAKQWQMNPLSIPMAAGQGRSCTTHCQERRMQCWEHEMYFINNCNALETYFQCEAGCAHQVGDELPVYVPDPMQPTYRQCLVTFISQMKCDAAHESTARLCVCTANNTEHFNTVRAAISR